ncbi:GNAT family N-acetyltransferase [Aspergillus saccharolyticus JOP 1030-1]|uniref:Acyl-CoA N-acyltransferase n=1 Tax=Aspergillus saccharolyticus JOP 1030-1 TaxID=1450539 RepID=A0A318ZKR2_9EURO|nr:acyl-CoA N-acyltransferase [Aspergillus saccharolyticus JOP 1030-1]PYH48096.1 acyl-CoA N-acyltransferase [Aspergillus saccharolyticus JOP 1030-1]
MHGHNPLSDKSLFRSPRLFYRAVEDNEEDRAFLQHQILNDPTIQTVSTMRLKCPLPSGSATEFIKALQTSILGVMICLPPVSDGDETAGTPPDVHDAISTISTTTPQPRTDPNKKPTPIGHLGFFNPWGSNLHHHRNAMLGISLAEGYRGRGYGAEAVNWALDWAFVHAGLHRVSLGAFAFNETAVKLYRRLGFVEEGRERLALLYRRRWHDVINFSMLEEEWMALRGME